MATTITVDCPSCHHKMRASSDYVGRKGRCPQCRSLVEIRDADQQPSLASTYLGDDQSGSRKALAGHGIGEAPGWLAALTGLIATAFLYGAILFPARSTGLGKIFLERGSIPYIVMFITMWGFATLVFKLLCVRKQQSYSDLELELIPLEIGLQIAPSNVEQFINHLGQSPSDQRNSIVGRRILGALEHFKSRNSVPEVQEYLSTQAQIDASGVDAGYTLLRSFIWAVPILGFIGTVMGISVAVGGLDQALSQGEEIIDAMPQVTDGLATAFDTTLVALAMAILLLFPTESLRKTEYQMLDRIESFANEQLLRRMSDDESALDLENMPEVVRDTLQSAFGEHQRWLAQWQVQVAELGRVVGADMERALVNISDKLREGEARRAEEMRDAGRAVSDLFDKVTESAGNWNQMGGHLEDHSQSLQDASDRLESTLANAADNAQALLARQSESIELLSASDFAPTMQSLQREIARLIDRLGQADGVIADRGEQEHDLTEASANGSGRRRFGFFGDRR